MIEVSRRSTKTLKTDGLHLHYREEQDIYNLVHYVIYGNNGKAPIYVNGKGITVYPQLSAQQIAEEMLKIQQLYHKCRGLRIRHEFVTITKDEFPDKRCCTTQIRQIADRFGDYYFYSGFQCVYSVFEELDRYVIRYAINTVSPMDGAKYSYNEYDIWEREQCCIECIVGQVTGKPGREFDFRELEYY